MAHLNKVMLIGRVVDAVQTVPFQNGGKVAKFRLAVSESRKNQEGQWENTYETVFIDCEVYNRGETGRQADTAAQYLGKGKQVLIEGQLRLDNWTDKNDGSKRSKIKILVDRFQFLGAPGDGASEGGGQQQATAPSRSVAPAGRGQQRSGGAPARPAPAYPQGGGDFGDDDAMPSGHGNEDEIPF